MNAMALQWRNASLTKSFASGDPLQGNAPTTAIASNTTEGVVISEWSTFGEPRVGAMIFTMAPSFSNAPFNPTACRTPSPSASMATRRVRIVSFTVSAMLKAAERSTGGSSS